MSFPLPLPLKPFEVMSCEVEHRPSRPSPKRSRSPAASFAARTLLASVSSAACGARPEHRVRGTVSRIPEIEEQLPRELLCSLRTKLGSPASRERTSHLQNFTSVANSL